MKQYLKTIAITQTILLGIGIITLMTLPLAMLFQASVIVENTGILYSIVHLTAFFVMSIRPLADIFKNTIYIRPLVILRKGFGVVSASIVVSILLAKIIGDPMGYIESLCTVAYWSLTNNALLAHLADITAVILLITSNNFSKRILGTWWKKIQKMSYVYFFSSALYVYLSYNENLVLTYMMIVALLTTLAFIMNTIRKPQQKLQ